MQVAHICNRGYKVAYVKCLPVGTTGHLHNLIDYVANDNKTGNQMLVHCSGCLFETCYDDFIDVKNMFNKNKGILAHQIIQSFKINEISTEKAFELSKEFAERALTGYQYTVCLHKDKEHIHAHIVFNSVNSITGKKYYGNKASLKMLQAINNNIMRENNLSVIEKQTGMRGIDKTTYQLAQDGKSWKVNLAVALDDILENAKDKEHFINLLEQKGYEIYYGNKNITVKVTSENKKIRLDTLAKQFGAQYTKLNVERNFKGLPIVPFETINAPVFDEKKTEFKQIEKHICSNKKALTNYEPKIKDKELSLMLRLENSMKNSRSLLLFLNRFLVFTIYKNSSKERKKKSKDFKAWQKQKKEGENNAINNLTVTSERKDTFKKFGNIPYNELQKACGANITINVSLKQADMMRSAGVFYSGLVKENGKIYVTFKKANEIEVSKHLGIDLASVKTVNEIAQERFANRMIELKSIKENIFICQYKCTLEDVLKLDKQNVSFSYYKQSDGNFKVQFLKNDLQSVCNILNKNFIEEYSFFSAKENNKNYAELKQMAQIENEKIAYRVVDKILFEKIANQDVKIAYFEKGEKYNIAMLESDIVRYEQIVKDINEKQEQEKHKMIVR